MKRIVFVNGKGGVGKSTTSFLMASILADAGQKIGLIDSDINQKSLTKALNVLKTHNLLNENIELATGDFSNYEVVIEDTPGRLDSLNKNSLRLADTIVLLTSASPIDIFTTADTLKELTAKGYDSKVKILYTKVRRGTSIASAIEEMSKMLKNGTFLTNHLYLRTEIQLLMLKGFKALSKKVINEVSPVIFELLLK